MPNNALAFLQPAEMSQLAGALDVPVKGLAAALEPHIAAATEEYVRMFLGQRVYTRGSDIREYRLFLLIKYAFGGRIPSDSDVSRLFQTTDTQSRSLVRSVMSKFQYELRDEVTRTVSALLAQATMEEGSHAYDVVVDSENMVEELNRKIQAIDGTLPAIQKKRGTASTYVIKPSSYEKLHKSLG